MKKRDSGSQNTQSANRVIMRRTLFLMLVCGILTFVILAVQLFNIQILGHEEYEQAAIEQQVRETAITANRGTIYDSTGTVLAKSASVENVYINPSGIKQKDEDAELIATGLADILELESSAVMEKIENRGSYYQTIKTKVEREVADKVRTFIKENKLESIYLEPSSKRYYPYNSVAAHLIGFVGAENTGLDGTEKYYDEYLTGTNGRVVRLKSATGTDMLFNEYENYYDSEDGSDVYLTIDLKIQQIVEKNLEQAVEDYDVQNGAAAVAMDPKTGQILAMASLGNYDLNDYSQLSERVQEELSAITDEEKHATAVYEAQLKMWRNKALSDAYEPGSTFKIITLSMALEEGTADLNGSYYCGGSITVPGRDSAVNCWKTAGHGAQTLQQVIQHSCNVGTVKLAEGVGAEKFYEYIEAYGLFDTTGIDVLGEGQSTWWPKDDWNAMIQQGSEASLAAAAFGQTFKITPIQLITAVSAAVNGGNLMQPYVVGKIVDTDGAVAVSNEPTVVRQVISEETSARVRTILESVVGDSEEGTGKNAYVSGYTIGGKTGTSTNTELEAETGDKEYIVSFIGFAPTDDPEICILVLLDGPSKNSGIYISGGQMAAPTVGNMMSEILPYMGVSSSYSDEELTSVNMQVPYVQGKGIDEATATLKDSGFAVRVEGDGDAVANQMPAAGATVISGTEVIIYVGESEKPTDQVAVPDVSSMTYAEAKGALEGSGLYLKTSGASISVSGVTVSKQSVAAGEQVARGTVIEVTLIDSSASNLGRY